MKISLFALYTEHLYRQWQEFLPKHPGTIISIAVCENLLHKIKGLIITVGLLNIFDNNCRSVLVDLPQIDQFAGHHKTG